METMRRGGWRTGGRAPLPARIRRDAPTHVRRHLDRWFSHRASTGHSKCRDISSHLKKYRQPWTRRCTPRRRLGRTPTSCGRDPRCRCTRRSPRGYKWGSNTRSSRAPGRRDSFRGREVRPTACSETRRYSWPRPRPFAAGGTSGSRPRPFGRAGHDPPFRRAGREPLRGNKKFTAPSCRIVASSSTPSTRRCSMAWRCELIFAQPGVLPLPPRAASSAFTSATMRAMAASSAAEGILAARVLASTPRRALCFSKGNLARETNPNPTPRITPGCLEPPTLSTYICLIAEAWF